MCPARSHGCCHSRRGCSQGSRSFGLVGNVDGAGNRALTIHCFLGLGSYCAKALRALNGFSKAPVSSIEKRKWKISPGSGGGVCNGSAHSRYS